MLLGSSWTGAQPPVETNGDLAQGTVGLTSTLWLHQDYSDSFFFFLNYGSTHVFLLLFEA